MSEKEITVGTEVVAKASGVRFKVVGVDGTRLTAVRWVKSKKDWARTTTGLDVGWVEVATS